MIIGFNNDYFKGNENFSFPELPEPSRCVAEILDPEVDENTLCQTNYGLISETMQTNIKRKAMDLVLDWLI